MMWAAAVWLAAAAGAPGTPPLQLVSQVPDSSYGCIVCHADKRRAFRQGVHSERGIRCHDCHGGDPASFETATAHRGRFVGVPTKRGVITLCSTCHADPNQMRQYGLSADQLAEFRTSRHGQLLLERGSVDAPTCTDCHDAHTILPPEDARSNVYPTNIPGTCARCHDDAALMARYGIPTDQSRHYRQGAHGVAVFDEQNFAAPTCIGCHGSHAALPPRVSEIANVCGHCHVLMEQAFLSGPHGRPASRGAFPGCVACHSNHGTEPIAPDALAALCATCHGEEGESARIGAALQEQIVASRNALRAAATAIEELLAGGHAVQDERFRYAAAVTEYEQLAQVQHSLDAQHLEDIGLRVRSNTAVIMAAAEHRADDVFEHRLLLVPMWFLTLAGMAFAWFKLREWRG